MEGDLSLFQTIVIAIVEGLTEFLPVSSTGHMIITQHILGVESTDFVKAFTFIIQFGAILSVVCLYWKNFFHLNHTPMPENCTPVKRFLHKYDFYWKLLVAFIPAAVLGLLFSDMIDAMLESVTVVAVMLIAGGIFMLFCDKIFGNGSEKTVLTEKRAFFIGLFQCISMIPGVSRSMATIVGGMAQKLTLAADYPYLNFRQVVFQQLDFIDDQNLGFQFYFISFSCQVVCTLTVNFACGKCRWYLFNGADKLF
jgi:undecaprenyl-diphosphatase